jgi:hypothetical protein
MEEMTSSEEYATLCERLCLGAGPGTPWPALAGTPAVGVIGRKPLILLILLMNGDVAATQQVIGIVTKQPVP